MAQQLTHKSVWKALDEIANQQGLTPSGLARRAGLDATTFNPSKRRAQGGRQRWPSTESIAKVLAATGTGVDEFFLLLDEGTRTKN